MTTPKNQQLIRHFPWHKIPLKIRIAAIVLLPILIIDIFLTGYLKFTYNYVRCGHVPVVDYPNQLYGGYTGYEVPGSSEYRVRAKNIYYCNRDDAEADGKLPDKFSEEGRQRLEELRQEGKIPR